MTRVFVYEYTCAAPPASLQAGGAASLSVEGEAMLRAVLDDFQRVAGVDAFTIRSVDKEEQALREAVRHADWSMIIAPESDDILLTRCRWVLEERGQLLGPSPDAIALCGDKLATCRWLLRHGIPTPPTTLLAENAIVNASGSYVLKPRFGAGCQDTTIIRSAEPNSRGASNRPFIIQPWIAGRAASIACLVSDRDVIPLLPGEQQIAIVDNQVEYRGGRIPLIPESAQRAERLGMQVVRSIPGLFGYIGVDLVLGDDGRDWVIEVNPRLTTSYVGLRALCESNLAELLLCLAEKREPPPVHWRAKTVEFAPDGKTKLV